MGAYISARGDSDREPGPKMGVHSSVNPLDGKTIKEGSSRLCTLIGPTGMNCKWAQKQYIARRHHNRTPLLRAELVHRQHSLFIVLKVPCR